MLNSALEHYQRQQRLTAAALVAARRRSWHDAQGVASVIAAFQVLAAEDSAASIGPMLAEQDLPDEPLAQVAPRSVAGVASDGRSLVGLLEQAVSPDALGLMVVTQVQDAARTIGAIGVGIRPHMGYVRMLNPPSCSRCAVLAGKFYKWNDGFLRHPRCDCRHIPSHEALAGDLTTNPDDYFHSLSPAEQDHIFTKGGAESIRLGADVSQVVNARRVTAGMQFAQGSQTTTKLIRGEEFTVNVKTATARRNAAGEADRRGQFTTEGVTARGLGGQQQKGLRQNGPQQARLMPETILMRAKDQADAVRLLKLHGYVFDADAAATGRAAFRAEADVRRAARQRDRNLRRRKAAL